MRKRILFLVVLLSLVSLAAGKVPARLEVLLYLDANGDRLMNTGEGVQGVPVLLKIDGDVEDQRLTQDGRVVFPLGYPLDENSRIQVEIPYLATAQKVSVGNTETLRAEFRLDAPELPVYLP